MKRFLALLVFVCLCGLPAMAQRDATTSRAGDLQVGGGFSIAQPDYGPSNLQGFNLYTTFDFRDWLGVEASFHNTTAGDGTKIYERTYEIGPRVVYQLSRSLRPYAKVLVGRGVFNYPPDCLDKTTHQQTSCGSPNVDPSTTGASANLAYNEFAMGAGVDFAVHRHINIRLDYEYQHWLSFQPHGLTPQVLSIGVAYHFTSGDLSIR
ncbi:MAG: porin family protein [Bryocella sp.]